MPARSVLLALLVAACCLLGVASSVVHGLRISPTEARLRRHTVQRGGAPIDTGAPDFSKGTPDGTLLPPYDPLGIAAKQAKKDAREQKKRQAKADEINRLENYIADQERETRRKEVEKAEEDEAKAEAAAAAALAAAKASFVELETSAAEGLEAADEFAIDAESEAAALVEADADAEAEVDTEAQVDAELEQQLAAEAEMDAQAELEDELEAEADAAESADDLSEMEDDMSDSLADKQEIESENETDDAAEESSASLVEMDGADAADEPKKDEATSEKEQVEPIMEHRTADKQKQKKTKLVPTPHVTYNRGDFAEEQFDNADSRAVFARRAKARSTVRFSRVSKSSGGQAVVNGVTLDSKGREITENGLFAPVVKPEAEMGPTVAAASPKKIRRIDDSVDAIRALPVVPQIREKKVADEYGDMPE